MKFFSGVVVGIGLFAGFVYLTNEQAHRQELQRRMAAR